MISSHVTPRNIVVVGGGIQGASVAYYLAKKVSQSASDQPFQVTVLEAVTPGAAASGKGGGFMGRSWGDGSPTQRLHELAFDLYEEITQELQCTSYRKLPVLSVAPSSSSAPMKKDPSYADFYPSWLDGKVGRIRVMGQGDDTAQVTPLEVVSKMLAAFPNRVTTVIGKCVGIESSKDGSSPRKVTGVRYETEEGAESQILPADAVVVCAGPWSCMAEDWFANDDDNDDTTPIQLPMEGIKSTSIVWKNTENQVDATALFCGEDSRFGTHLEVYPRPDGTIYICGIGGSDYIPKDSLKDGMYLTNCDANEARVQAAMASFQTMSSTYAKNGVLDRSQACMRPCPPDAMPYMGSIPGYSGAYINAGHNCWGIAWAPACGLAMAELVLEGSSTSVDLKPFNPSRFTRQTSHRGRKKQGVDVGEQW